ncbi:dihydroorotate dehydrogenase-like protein [Actinomarinicola tropica]|uniref:Dihydroorotate dehydrogenase-like protein n=1 Tax=Actinomarinicola tropica TaxID=2789776 RepID=A0A5Q2RMM3_9ACTN|nr:dihydroorotate dehydrogenase-like protein [Actinomarinicola tropica]QGG95666.1 dihydroorotate dehydrogenase-like protein [Actinomarinicola tropica]
MDLTTRYLGLDLRTPIVASASPLNGHVDSALQVEAAGAAAIVMPSLFEEEIVHEEVELTRALEAGSEHFAEALDYFPDVDDAYMTTTDRYLATLESLAARCEVPVIASLNATSPGGWTWHASLLERAGAAALELNLYHLAADPTLDATAMEHRDLQIVEAVRTAVSIPVAVKLSPHYSAMANFAARVVDAGADGLVLFNRFYQPDLDLESLEVVNRVELSHPGEMRLPLRWMAILRPQLGPDVSLALTTGVHSGTDVVKALMSGADVAMLTSALLRNGASHLRTVESQLVAWLEDHEYESTDQLRGSATTATSGDAAAFERTNYVQVLHSWAAPHHLTPSSPSS